LEEILELINDEVFEDCGEVSGRERRGKREGGRNWGRAGGSGR
jgi:hypothetical protein